MVGLGVPLRRQVPYFVAMAEAIAVAIVGAVAGELVSRGMDLLRRDPQQRAFKTALRQAGSEMLGSHPALRDEDFLRRFLTEQPGRAILARALLRDEFPMPGELADAYLARFPGDAAVDRETATQLADEFLIRFHLALRRQRDLQSLFDSQALDAAARYLYLLLEESRLEWVRLREQRVDEALAMYGGAAGIYEYAARQYLRAGRAPEWIQQQIVVPAYRLTRDAAIRLRRMEYSDADRLQQAWADLVEDRYESLEEATQNEEVLRRDELHSGIEDFNQLLARLPPL